MKIHEILLIFIFLASLILLSSCRLRGNDDGTPSLVNFTINGEKGRPFNRFNSNNPLVIKVTATSKNPIISIFLIAVLNNTTDKTLHSCNNSPCEFSWLVSSLDNGSYEIKAEVIDDKGNRAIFQYDGDSSNPSDASEVDVIINVPS